MRTAALILALSGAVLVTVGCAGANAEPAWPRLVAAGQWGSALRSVAVDCGELGAPKEACSPNEDGRANTRMYEAREKVYERFLEAYPLRVRVGVLRRQEAATLTGLSVPSDVDEHALVVATRISLPKLPEGITWRVDSVQAFLVGDLAEHIVYRDQVGEDAEDFVVSFGGAPRPSSLAKWKKTEPFASVEAFRKKRLFSLLLDEDRYDLPVPKKSSSDASSSSSSSTSKRTTATDAIVGVGVVGLAFLPVTIMLDALDFFSGPKPSGQSSPEFLAWMEEIKRRRSAENVEWTRDARVATLVRLWHGAWEAGQQEILVTYGYEVHRPDPLAKPPVGRRYNDHPTMSLVLRPVANGTALPAIYVEVKVPRKGDLRADLEAFEKEEPRTVGRVPGGEARWQLDQPQY